MGSKWNDQWWSLVKSQQKKGASAMANDMLAVGSHEWAHDRCAVWNWHYNAAEIARELITAGIRPGSAEMQRVKKAFLDFFRHERAAAWWEFIEQAVEVFGS